MGPWRFAKLAVQSALGSGRAPEAKSVSARTELALGRLNRSWPAAQRRRGGRLQLALVTPFPPDQTGIADYSAQLYPALSSEYEVTIITPETRRAGRGLPPSFGYGWFLKNGGQFDRVLYHFGNSPFHMGMIDLLAQIPGVVVLHDFGLGELAAEVSTSGLDPAFWPRMLYDSHGLPACQAWACRQTRARLADRYPCSRFVFDQAQGVLVHSRFAKDLALRHYGEAAAARTSIVPFLQTSRRLDRRAARKALGLSDADLLVCSFGFVGPAKRSEALLAAWKAAELGRRARLVFVGKAPAGQEGRDFDRALKDAAPASAFVTGFAPREVFETYLAAADFAVQLRSNSRGETSGAVFDCLAAGTPVIVNAHGALGELPDDTVLQIPEDFEQEDLCFALRRLAKEPRMRQALGERGRELVRRVHAPSRVAAIYAAAIEGFVQHAGGVDSPDALAAAKAGWRTRRPSEKQRLETAEDLVRAAGPRRSPACLFVDVTAIAAHDLGTGIQRVVRAQLLELLKSPPTGMRVEPVRLAEVDGKMVLLHARTYAARLIGLPLHLLADAPVELAKGDIYYLPDLAPEATARAAEQGLFQTMRAAGISLHVLVHDLLPMTLPQCFPPGAPEAHRRWFEAVAKCADQLICISEAVRQEAAQALADLRLDASAAPSLSMLHHGADLEAAAVEDSLTPEEAKALEAARLRPTILMVGTIEPRKAYDQALAALEHLWATGHEVNLVIVGREGWRDLPVQDRRSIPATVKALRASPELGHRLFWLDGGSDAALRRLLQESTVLLAASWGEGLGLPVIEAARWGLPVLARDIPVFREVAGQGVSYFSARTPEDLAAALRAWLQASDQPTRSDIRSAAPLSWSENVAQLKALLQTPLRSGSVDPVSSIG